MSELVRLPQEVAVQKQDWGGYWARKGAVVYVKNTPTLIMAAAGAWDNMEVPSGLLTQINTELRSRRTRILPSPRIECFSVLYYNVRWDYLEDKEYDSLSSACQAALAQLALAF